MEKHLPASSFGLEADLALYEDWAARLGYEPSEASLCEEVRARHLYAWLDAQRMRLRAMEPVLVPSSGAALTAHGGLVKAVIALEAEFSQHGFLEAQQEPLDFELFIHDLDDFLSAEPEFDSTVFDVTQDDLELLVSAVQGEALDEQRLKNAFLRLSAVVVRWVELNDLFSRGNLLTQPC